MSELTSSKYGVLLAMYHVVAHIHPFDMNVTYN